MDERQFDRLTRMLSTRRATIAGALGGAAMLLGLIKPDEAMAHNPIRRCLRIRHRRRRRTCLRAARRHVRRQHRCTAESKAMTCANRCGTARNNCNDAVSCTCPAGTSCLASSVCNPSCSDEQPSCPPGCVCGALLADDLSARQCYQGPPLTTCEQMPVSCDTSADCPAGFFCGAVGAQCVTNRCIPVCQVRIGGGPV